MNGESSLDICILPCVKQLVGSRCITQGASLALCDDLEWWDREKRGRQYRDNALYDRN